jgi:hypothetical protein
MPFTKAQIDRTLDLFERFVEAHEAVAEAAVIMSTPTVQMSGNLPSIEISAQVQSEEVVTVPEPAQGASEDSASDPFSLGGSDEPVADPDSPALDLGNAKAVSDFKTTLGNLLRDYGKATDPETALGLIEEVTGSTKFSECPPDKLEELHDAVYDALAELE